MTNEAKQQIIDAHLDQYGYFTMSHFVSVVAADPEHPAHDAICPEGWREKAEHVYLMEKGRLFIKGLRIMVLIEVKEAEQPVEVPFPSLVADTRQPHREGEPRQYLPADAPNALDVLDHQAEEALGQWATRYMPVIVDPKRLCQLSAMVRRMVKTATTPK